MKIYLGTDHAGFDLKEKVKAFLAQKGYTVMDCGADAFDKNDDYPDFIHKAAVAVSKDTESKGIIFGGSGQGEAMVANKVAGIRAAVFYGPKLPAVSIDAMGKTSADLFEMIRLTREHNDTNVLSFGARFVTDDEAFQAIELFLRTPFSGDERHTRRIEKMKKLEK